MAHDKQAAMKVLSLRPYQDKTIRKVYDAYGAGYRRPATVLPTGGGKTYVFSHVARDAIAAGGRVLVLAHRTELIESAEEELRGVVDGVSIGVLQGTRREVTAEIIVASVQTAVRPAALALLQQCGFTLVIVDEVHHVAASSYQTILRELRVFEPDGPRMLGVTATLVRGDKLALGETIDTVAHTVSVRELIDDGFLLRPIGVRVRIDGLDMSRVKRSRTSESGLDDRAVAAAMHDALAPEAIAKAVAEHIGKRTGVAFLPTVELSKEQASAFRDAGLTAVHVDADTPKAERKEIIRKARLGEYQMICNVGLFTEGTNIPIWSLVALARPTSSPILFPQMAGRGMRAYPGQADCLLLDFCGVGARHSLQSVATLEGVDKVIDLEDELLIFDDLLDDETEGREESALHTPPKEPRINGPLAAETFDVFGAAHAAWQRSPAGRWYLRTGGKTAVVLEGVPGEPDLYDVWDGQTCVHERCDLSAAMAWGEQAAGDRVQPREAGWRAGRVSAREKMMAVFTAGRPPEVSDAGGFSDLRDADWAARYVDQ